MTEYYRAHRRNSYINYHQNLNHLEVDESLLSCLNCVFRNSVPLVLSCVVSNYRFVLMQAIHYLQEMPVDLTVTDLGHTPNWLLVSDIVNASSRTYRTARQVGLLLFSIFGIGRYR